ncbi:MAG: hypothetical protein OXF27_01580, partial [Acidobacteria bacterium]|nr:hypothetical protein [Acidobacteriota bacterium]
MVPRLQQRADALMAHDWTQRDAERLTLVCLHSGVFFRSQYLAFIGRSNPALANRFVRPCPRVTHIADERLVTRARRRALPWKWQLEKGPLWPREKGPPVVGLSWSSRRGRTERSDGRPGRDARYCGG